jgi:cytochrome c biogenesis protein
VTVGRSAVRSASPGGPVAGALHALRCLLTSVRFAVVQIVAIAIVAVVGMTVRQLPGFAFRTDADYAEQMALLRERYEPVLGRPIVDLMERLGLFAVFTSWWFTALLVLLVVSIVVCTLDRLPRLWRQASEIRVVQPAPFYDPALPERAAMTGVTPEAAAAVLRRRRFHVRTATDVGATYVYGDRNRWPKLATLLTHAGLVLFLVAAAVSGRFGFEAGLLIPQGEAVPVERLGTPGNVVLKNEGFSAPRLPDGRFADFATDLAVYRDGALIAQKVIRVNDPLEVAGYSFHQNFFGPAVDLAIRATDGSVLWDGWVPLDAFSADRPYGRLAVPGRDVGLELLLDRAEGAPPLLAVIGSRRTGVEPDGSPRFDAVFVGGVAEGATFAPAAADFTIDLRSIGAYTGIVAKRDPGLGLVWLAFGLLIVGLVLTFYLPRRRVWMRVDDAGELRVAWASDRYVSVRRELGSLLTDLVAVRVGPGSAPGLASASAAAVASGPDPAATSAAAVDGAD